MSFLITGCVSGTLLVNSRIVCSNIHALTLVSTVTFLAIKLRYGGQKMGYQLVDALRQAAAILVYLGLRTVIFDKVVKRICFISKRISSKKPKQHAALRWGAKIGLQQTVSQK